MFFFKTFLTVSVLALFSCATQPLLDNNLFQKKGHWKLYSNPDFTDIYEDSEDIRRIVIVGTNDFHGALEPIKETTAEKDKKNSIEYPVGGAEIIASYFKILRNRYANQILFLDAGDIFQGSFISDRLKGEPTIRFYNYLDYDALTFGNHEFDFGGTKENPQSNLIDLIKRLNPPVISSNIIDIKTRETPKWENIKPYLMKKINGINVGIIGTTTLETPTASSSENIKGIYFANHTHSIIKYAQKLRMEGADIVVLLTHSGFFCAHDLATKTKVDIKKFNFEPQNSSLCNPTDELFDTITRIPKGVIDAIVSGHTHTKIANFINNIPVIQSYKDGLYFGRIELYYDIKKKRIINKETVIHQPTKFCQIFFKESQDCYGKDENINHTEQVPASFLGATIVPDETLTKILAPYREEISKIVNLSLINIDEDLPHYKMEFPSPFGQLVVDAVRDSTNTQIAFINAGGIKNGLYAGNTLYSKLYKALPYTNDLVTLELTGEQLKKAMAIGTSGYMHGLLLTSGIKIIISKSKDTFQDLNKDGKQEDWERDRITSITLADGTPIVDEAKYSITTVTYLSDGNENFDVIFNNIAKKDLKNNSQLNYRDATAKFLIKINKLEQTEKNKFISRYLDHKNLSLTITP